MSIDPLAALAETQQALHARFVEVAPTPSPELLAAWQAEAEAALRKFARPLGEGEGEKVVRKRKANSHSTLWLLMFRFLQAAYQLAF